MSIFQRGVSGIYRHQHGAFTGKIESSSELGLEQEATSMDTLHTHPPRINFTSRRDRLLASADTFGSPWHPNISYLLAIPYDYAFGVTIPPG